MLPLLLGRRLASRSAAARPPGPVRARARALATQRNNFWLSDKSVSVRRQL